MCKYSPINGTKIEDVYFFTCSAGVGCTGTFITLDICLLEQADVEHMVGIPNIMNNIRHQRMKLVQTVVCVSAIAIKMIPCELNLCGFLL